MTLRASGTVLHCDLDGTIHEVPTDGLGVAAAFPIGRLFDQLVAGSDAATARQFIAAIPEQGAVFDRMLAVDLPGGRTVFGFNGMAVDGGLLIAVRWADSGGAIARSAIEALAALNNRLVNRQRELTRTSMTRATPLAAASAVSTSFSVREGEVVPMLLDGLSNQLIARRLGIEESAVKARLRTIFKKLGVASRGQAIKALLVDIGHPEAPSGSSG